VLDLPCGAGRFWPLLAEKPNRVIIGADNSSRC
jgi:cyclopropane fatty-acyl-phospholipid synthase-like methyltransferase